MLVHVYNYYKAHKCNVIMWLIAGCEATVTRTIFKKSTSSTKVYQCLLLTKMYYNF